MNKSGAVKILVIDEDQADCDLIARTLTGKGIEVIFMLDSRNAAKKAERIGPALIFINIQIAGDETAGVIHSLQSHDALKRVPIIGISRHGAINPLYAATLGVAGILQKPLQVSEIIGKTVAVLGGDPLFSDQVHDLISKTAAFLGDEPDVAHRDQLSRRERETGGDAEHAEEDESGAYDFSGDESIASPEELSVLPGEEAAEPEDDLRGEETVSGTKNVEEIAPASFKGGLFDEEEETLFASGEGRDDGDLASIHERSGYSSRIRDGDRKKSYLVYWVCFIFAALVAGAILFSGTHKKITDALFTDTTEETASVSDRIADSELQESPEDGAPGTEEGMTDRFSETLYGGMPEDTAPLPEAAETDGLPGDMKETEERVLYGGAGEASPSPESDAAVTGRKKTRVPLPKAVFQGKSVYSLQAGVYSVRKNAEAISATLRQRGYEVVIREISGADGVRLQKVLVGKFDTRSEALDQSKALLQKEGIKSLVVSELVTDRLKQAAPPGSIAPSPAEQNVPPGDRSLSGTSPPGAVAPGKSGYSLQIGAYTAKKNADSISEELTLKGYDVFILRSSNADGTFLYRVLVGEFDTQVEALRQSAILQKEGIRSVIYSH